MIHGQEAAELVLDEYPTPTDDAIAMRLDFIISDERHIAQAQLRVLSQFAISAAEMEHVDLLLDWIDILNHYSEDAEGPDAFTSGQQPIIQGTKE